MKRWFLCSLILGLPLSVSAQGNASTFLARLPEPPSDACGLTPEARTAYLEQVDAVVQDIEAALEKREAEQEGQVERNQGQWKEQMARQVGLTDAEAAAARDADDPSDAEARRLADGVLQRRANISLDEAENLANLDEKGQEAWAQAYAAEMTAGIQAQTPAERSAAEKGRAQARNVVGAAREQQELLKTNRAEGVALQQKMLEWERAAQVAYTQGIAPIDRRLAQCEKDLDAARAADQFARIRALTEQVEQIRKERNTALKAYCAQFTPAHCDMIRRYLAWAKAAQRGFDRYEEMENERFRLQTDTPGNTLLVNVGTLGLKEARQCATVLSSAFKYVRFSDDGVEFGAR